MAKKVVVIGSGVGGLACGAALAQKGFSVTVLESHPYIGGRCTAFEQDGFVCDFGVHMFSLGNKGPHGQAARRLDTNLCFVTRNPACRVMGRADFDFPLDIKPLHRMAWLALKLKVRPSRYFGAWRLFRALMTANITPEMESMTLRDFVARYSDDPSVHVFITCVCQLYFAIDYLSASAAEFALSFSAMFNEAAFGYPMGGCKAIPESFAAALERAGGKILLEKKVTKIRVEQGRVLGVETQDGFYPADLVLSGAGAGLTTQLAGKDNFSREFASQVEAMRPSNPYITLKYALKYPVIEYPVVFHMPNLPAEEIFAYIKDKTPPKDPYIFMPVPSNHDPALAPPGMQLVIAGTAAPEGADKELCNRILDVVDSKVKELFPKITDALLWESRSMRTDVTALTGHPAGEAIGLAQTPDQSGPNRLPHKMPVEGLFLVGADAQSRGIGTEMAVRSGLALADTLLANRADK
jgi:prolycopene isomerase